VLAGPFTVDIKCTMRESRGVRTTLKIDDDVLQAAREIAANSGRTTGEVLSELARRGLQPGLRGEVRNGVPLLPRRPNGSRRPTMGLVNHLRDEA